jgi:hypothetical protein
LLQFAEEENEVTTRNLAQKDVEYEQVRGSKGGNQAIGIYARLQ